MSQNLAVSPVAANYTGKLGLSRSALALSQFNCSNQMGL
jgi:hypothetical protein